MMVTITDIGKYFWKIFADLAGQICGNTTKHIVPVICGILFKSNIIKIFSFIFILPTIVNDRAFSKTCKYQKEIFRKLVIFKILYIPISLAIINFLMQIKRIIYPTAFPWHNMWCMAGYLYDLRVGHICVVTL